MTEHRPAANEPALPLTGVDVVGRFRPTPDDQRSILEQDTLADTAPSEHDTVAEDSVTDFDPQPPILEDE